MQDHLDAAIYKLAKLFAVILSGFETPDPDLLSRESPRKRMKPERVPTPICIISSHQLAAKFLRNILRALESRHKFAEPEQLREYGCKINPLFMIDCIQLAFPLSDYVSRLRARYPDALFIAIDRESKEKEIPYMLSLGIHGFVAHDLVETSLEQAVEGILTGRVWIPQRALRTQRLQSYSHQSQLGSKPTHREMQVLELVQRRFSNKEIGDALRIRESTVKYHVSNLLGKLEVNDRKELVRNELTNDATWIIDSTVPGRVHTNSRMVSVSQAQTSAT